MASLFFIRSPMSCLLKARHSDGTRFYTGVEESQRATNGGFSHFDSGFSEFR